MARGRVQIQGMRRFFKQDIAGDTVRITGQEAKHISRVLRMQEGDMLILFDGSGTDCLCRIAGIGADYVEAAVEERKESDKELPVRITLYQAVIKSDHLDYAVQKCTEAGVFAFVPFLSGRCVKRPDEKSAKKLVERENRIAMEAAKQCGRARIPQVEDVVSLDEAVKRLAAKPGLKLVAYENERKTTIKELLQKNAEKEIHLFIGPEGGFSEEEIGLLEGAGVRPCSLGKLILRAETAGVAAAAMIQYETMGN